MTDRDLTGFSRAIFSRLWGDFLLNETENLEKRKRIHWRRPKESSGERSRIADFCRFCGRMRPGIYGWSMPCPSFPAFLGFHQGKPQNYEGFLSLYLQSRQNPCKRQRNDKITKEIPGLNISKEIKKKKKTKQGTEAHGSVNGGFQTVFRVFCPEIKIPCPLSTSIFMKGRPTRKHRPPK